MTNETMKDGERTAFDEWMLSPKKDGKSMFDAFQAGLRAARAASPQSGEKAGDSPAGAPAAVAPQPKPRLLNQLRRFNECCEDFEAGGHDVDKEDMRALADLGAVRPAPGGRHYMTDFGRYLLTDPTPTVAAPQAALTDEQRRALGSAVAALERNGWIDPAAVVHALLAATQGDKQ